MRKLFLIPLIIAISGCSKNRNKDLIKLHSKWLDAHVELQPFELKKKLLENKLKVLVGEYQGIKDICS